MAFSQLVLVVYAFDPALRMQRQVLCEFKDIVVYKESSMIEVTT